ncbi:STAS domain-containing protein [Polymorphospora rubra]|uniref:STAS domain-containing protein n=1 Tax=Polymorphospora rubra TaxID=338584 RepID=UPI0033E9CF44
MDRPMDSEGQSRDAMSLVTHTVDGHTVLEVGGEVDLVSGTRLRERFLQLIDGGSRSVVVDLGGVTFIDSTGLGVLLGGLKRLRAVGGTFSLVCDKEPLLKIFRITALDQVFPIFATAEEALNAGQAGPAA